MQPVRVNVTSLAHSPAAMQVATVAFAAAAETQASAAACLLLEPLQPA
jgi:hypothetical protein